MRKSTASTLILLTLLSACASAPRVIVQRVCPAIPPLEQAPAAQQPSFSARMQTLLSGKLPEQTDYSLTLPNAKLPTARPVTP